ncbi:CGNR zinc finger domain-containing protein [Stenotrophomonas rhizophila]
MIDSAPSPALFVANDLALDFINSAYGPSTAPVDVLQGDQAAIDWLAAAGVLDAGAVPIPKGVAALAAALRDEARELLTAARAGRPFQAPVVNRVLEAGRPIVQLQSSTDGAGPCVVERRRDDSAESLLEPIAVALSRLLAGGDLQHVRECEAHDCTLLFHDTTKSRKRRWCSMALCGNRMKVAAFRSRKLNPPGFGGGQ